MLDDYRSMGNLKLLLNKLVLISIILAMLTHPGEGVDIGHVS